MNNTSTTKLSLSRLLVVLAIIGTYACSSATEVVDVPFTEPEVATLDEAIVPSPDPRVGLGAGLFDAEDAIWNLELSSATPPPDGFVGFTNSDLAFTGQYAIQGNYNGILIWDITDPKQPVIVQSYECPASQNDVSVYGNLLFVSSEGLGARLDCGTEGIQDAVSEDRIRGIRIFDITDITNPEYITNVQTCRGSHTHSVLKDPEDDENVYVYISGSYIVRSEEELAGCLDATPDENENTALFRIEVIQVPLDNPADAKIVSSPRIFEGLTKADQHGLAPSQIETFDRLTAEGRFPYVYTSIVGPFVRVAGDNTVKSELAKLVEERGGEGEPTAADSARLREIFPEVIDRLLGIDPNDDTVQRGPDQCHDITIYAEIGLAGGACEGYGLLLDISDPVNPTRIDAVSDSNFAYWHSATFNNDGTSILFTDEWGGGGGPKCQESDPYEWGANAIFTIEDGKMVFQDYYKMPAAQTAFENCVAHNGSLIPVPGRDIMVQSWYQGGISIFDFTDPSDPVEIAFHDRGPTNGERMGGGGSWSVYWYNGKIVNSEIARGLDIFELVPSPFITENEIAAANTVEWDYLNAQGHPKIVWPTTYHLAKAYVDQMDRDGEMGAEVITSIRQSIANAEANPKVSGKILNELAETVEGMVTTPKSEMLVETLKGLASM